VDLSVLAEEAGDKAAYVMLPSEEVVTYRELDQRSNRCAHLMRSLGLMAGDHISILMENNVHLFEIAWAAQRSGLIYTIINTHLQAAEAAYMVNDSLSELLFTSARQAERINELRPLLNERCRIISVSGPLIGCGDYAQLVRSTSTQPLADESEGSDMLYSSGTTGRPKGIVVPEGGMSAGSDALVRIFRDLWKTTRESVYLSPAPLYHTAPLRSCMSVQRLGATVIVMEKFEPRDALAAIERHRVTHSQWVPTMFTRMLRLPPEDRSRYDLSSLQVAVHAAAPCPRLIKEQMMAWWGPILYEYYGATEGNGFVHITPEEWLAYPGSVGRAMGAEIHIVGESGEEVETGADGVVYLSGGSVFEYHNDPGKTRDAYNQQGWSTTGDIGHLDAEGHLYLTDRKTFMIISGGVNIYPQEIEDLLISHPKVLDAAVFGIPEADLGEEVKAVVVPVDQSLIDGGLEDELAAYCRINLAHYKCPRSFDFAETLPRDDNGKLYKRLLRDEYLTQPGTPLPT
jgi:long-chain acyl-CoA synthetase